MKCPSCGAETTGVFCEYCGSELPKDPIVINNNYYGTTGGELQTVEATVIACERCGSHKVQFRREETYVAGVYRTVAICSGCGNTWTVSQDEDVALSSYTRGNTLPKWSVGAGSRKSKVVALLLCLTSGYFGTHYFYIGRYGMAIAYFFTGGFFGIGWFVDVIRIATGNFTDKDGYPLE